MMRAETSTRRLSAQIARSVLRYYKPTSKVLPKITQLIRANKKFLLTTHVGADADGLGSQIGLYFLLKTLRKDVVILNNEKVPEYLEQLIPGKLVHYLGRHDLPQEKAEQMMHDRFIFILDSSEPHRSEQVGEMFLRLNRPWATIDHHVLPGKKEFCVDPSYAATAELIWDLYQYLKKPVSKQAALALYTGMVADSGNFRYPKTSLRAHLMGGHLLSFGINSDFVYRAIYESNPLDRLKLYARLYPKVELLPNKVVYLPVLQNDRAGLELGDSGTEGIVNHLLAHRGLRAAALLTETEHGELKASLRSIGDVDVASIAKKFGGGGHKNAAGLKVREPFADALKKVLNELGKL